MYIHTYIHTYIHPMAPMALPCADRGIPSRLMYTSCTWTPRGCIWNPFLQCSAPRRLQTSDVALPANLISGGLNYVSFYSTMNGLKKLPIEYST